MPANKREKKLEKQRQKKKRKLAKRTRQRVASAAKSTNDDTAIDFFDVAESMGLPDGSAGVIDFDLAISTSGSEIKPRSNSEAESWWDKYLKGGGEKRLAMVRSVLNRKSDEKWIESLFPECIFEVESKVSAGQYVSMLEELEHDHREIYLEGMMWFLRSRVSHYLNNGEDSRAAEVATAHARELTETTEAYYGTVSMLRLCGQAEAAEALADAAFGIIDDSDLMPWAVDEIVHVLMLREMCNCISEGANDDALERMESELAKIDINSSDEMIQLRRAMTLRLAGKEQTQWNRNQLTASGEKGSRNRYYLSFEFAGWLAETKGLPYSAADELRDLICDSFGRENLTIKDYLDGVSEACLDRHLASLLGFMCMDQFKAPATLIAVEYFAEFLNERGLSKPIALTRTMEAVDSLGNQLARLFKDDTENFRFLARLGQHSK